MSSNGRLRERAWTVRTLTRAGVIPVTGPLNYARMVGTARRYGLSPATTAATAAIRAGDTPAIVAEDGAATWRELDDRSSSLAVGLREMAGRSDPTVALMARNSRAFVETVLATTKAGGRVLLLNTGFAGPQLADVVEREDADIVVFDEEFRQTVGASVERMPSLVAYAEEKTHEWAVADLIDRNFGQSLSDPAQPGRMILLTSGTSGTPKGAERGGAASGVKAIAGFFDRIPLRPRDVTVVGAPMFHAWGFAGLTLGSARAGTLVVHRRFDAEKTLAQVAAHQASVLWLVPVMLERIMNLPAEVRAQHDLSSLRVVALSGSAVRADAVTSFMDAYGDIVYNNYSSTEVGWASIATPADLRDAPATAGRPPRGTSVRILDDDGTPVRGGITGRIFVHNDALFEGYTGGGNKDVIDGFMSTGDVGHLDDAGRLYVDGRDDDMIVSGGENVYPIEVEQLLAVHSDVADVAVVGVPDDEYGARLVAFVVLAQAADPVASPEQLREFVRQNLARHKVPRAIITLDQLPRNAAGKVVKRELRDASARETT